MNDLLKEQLKVLAGMLGTIAVILILIVLPFIISLVPTSIRMNKTVREIKSFSHVSSVDHFRHPSIDSLFASRTDAYQFGVYFKNGGEIHVEYLSARGRELKNGHWWERGIRSDRAEIISINGYKLIFSSLVSHTDRTKRETPKDFALWSAILGVQIESIFDLVEHYDAISRHIESWTDITNRDTRLVDIIANGDYSATVTVEGVELALFKERIKKLQPDEE